MDAFSGFVFVPSWDINRDHIGMSWICSHRADLEYFWNAQVVQEDANWDGKANILDMVLIGLHWLETW
jgi:hypothetical protein